MQIAAITSIGTFQDVEEFSILKGEKFELQGSGDVQIRFFTDNDPVLSLVQSPVGVHAKVEALEAGDCEVQIQEGGSVVKKLFIRVYSTEATSLEVKSKVEKK